MTKIKVRKRPLRISHMIGIKETSEILGVTKSRVKQLCYQEGLPYIAVEGFFIFNRFEVLDFDWQKKGALIIK